MKTFLGIDVGSLTCKIVLIDEKAEIIYAKYFRTEGNPIEAIQKGLKELGIWIENYNPEIEICGVGTTGSARHLAGVITGADLIKNEITAHAKGTTHFIPDVRTIIEIGGQDSKIIILENGVAVDFAMNLLCAAGTGSFLDAQAFRLDLPIEKFGELALKSKNPTTVSSRCLTEDNYLLTTEGVKSIKDIRVGDFVFSKGQFKKVTQKYERKYTGWLHKIYRRYSADTPLILSSRHPVLAIKTKLCPYKKYNYICREDCDKSIRPRCQLRFYRDYSPQWIKVKDLKPYDLIVTPKHNTSISDPRNIIIPIDRSYFSPKKKNFFEASKFLDKNLMRLCGYYLAEGCTFTDNKGKYETQFALNEAEKGHIEDIRNLMCLIFKTSRGGIYQNFYTGNGIQLKFGSRAAHIFLKQFGQGAPNKKIPWWVFDLPRDYLMELIKGFWRGDGSYANIDHLTFYSSSPHLIEGLYVILEKCGYIASKKKYFEDDIGTVTSHKRGRENPIIRQHPLYKLDLGGKQMQKLYEDLDIKPSKEIQEFFKRRKRTYQIAYNKEDYIFYPIRKIEKEKVKNVKVYNLEIEDTHSYLVNGFLCKNCTIFAESDMIHKQQIGHKVEDIVAGLCQGLARNFLSNVAKGKNIQPPIVFLGGVSENVGMRWAFEKALNQKIVVPKYNTVLGAFGVALLVKEMALAKTKFLGFEISDKDIKCTSFICHGCPNQCEVIEARIEGKVIARWGDRCGKYSNLTA
jgi:predicted CoA-substrate-specific enzyme activase